MPSLDDFDPVFQAAGQEWNVDPTLLKAMAAQESSGRTNAVSSKGALGLMQIMPDTAKGLGVTDPNDPVQSIWGAAKYMNHALDKEGSVEGALLNYHGGDGWRGAFGPESRAYVPAVAARYKALTAATSQDTGSSVQAAPTASDASPGGSMSLGQPPSQPPMVVGDSLASRGGLGGTGMIGAQPSAIRATIAQGNQGNAFQGRDVVLSTGASNAPSDATNIEGELQNLKDGGAGSVTILGVGPGIEAKTPGTNALLAKLADKYGARFVPLPVGQMSADGVHPNALGYKSLRNQLALR